MKKIRFGIIGLGNQGTTYALHLFDEGRIENGIVSAMCDIDESKIKNIRAKTSNQSAKYFRDYKEMLDSGLCDAVLVETPHYLHPEMVEECLKRNLHVICEKPAGVYTAQVRQMNEAAEKSEAKFAVMFNQRTNCVYRKMREIVKSGQLGELQRVTWIITDWYRPQHYYETGGWRATWSGEGGGVLINQCPHQLDLLQWVTGGLPKSVRGFCHYGKWHEIEVEDDVTVYLEYENGATGIFVTTTGETPGSNRFEISGTKGKLLCENDRLKWYKNAQDSQEFSRTTKESFSRPDCECVEVETDGKNPQHAGILNNFANALWGLEEFFVDGREGIKGVELMNAIELSGWRGGAKVTLPVDEREYLEELNKHCKVSRKKVSASAPPSDTSGSYGSQGK